MFYQIFEIGADNESALDVNEYGGLPTIDENGQMKQSTSSRRHSGVSGVSVENPDVTVHPQGGRPRAQSLLHRGVDAAHAFTSPLAQIFHPLNVGHDSSVAESGSNFGGRRRVVSSPPVHYRSESPEDSKSPKITVEDLTEEGTGAASDAVRLQRLEEGQKRIEDMLIKLMNRK